MSRAPVTAAQALKFVLGHGVGQTQAAEQAAQTPNQNVLRSLFLFASYFCSLSAFSFLL